MSSRSSEAGAKWRFQRDSDVPSGEFRLIIMSTGHGRTLAEATWHYGLPKLWAADHVTPVRLWWPTEITTLPDAAEALASTLAYCERKIQEGLAATRTFRDE